MKKEPVKILIFEDNPGDVRLIKEYLRGDGQSAFDITHVECLIDGLESLNQELPDMVLLDLGLPDSQGLDSLIKLKSQVPDVPVIVLTGLSDSEMAIKAVNAGAQDYLIKGEFTADLLVRAIQYARARQQAEQQIKYQANLLANVNDAIIASDEKYRITTWNAAAEVMYGWQAKEVLGRSGLDIVRTEWLEADAGAMRQSIVETGAWRGEATQARKNGSRFHVELSSMMLYNANKQIVGNVSVNRDITERKRAEVDIHYAEEHLRFVLEGSQQGTWDWNIETGEVLRNERWAEMIGYKPQEIETSMEAWARLVHPDDYQAAWAALQEHLEGRSDTYQAEYRMLTKTGEYKWVLDRAQVVIFDPNGRPIRMSGTHTDISESKKAQEDLKRRNEEIRILYHASRQLSESLETDALFHNFHNLLAEIMDCDSLFISAFDSKTDLIHAVYGILDGNQIDISEFPPIPLEPEGQGVQSQAIHIKDSLMIDDLQAQLNTANTRYFYDEDSNFVERDAIAAQEKITQSALIIPILLENQVVGVVQIFSYQLGAYTLEQLHIAEAMVSQIAVASQNAKLYQQAQNEIVERKQAEARLIQQTEELKRSNEKLVQLYRVTKSLVTSTPFNLSVLGQTIVDTIARELQKPICSLYLIKKHSNELMLLAASGQNSDDDLHLKIALDGSGLIPQAIRSSQLVYAPDVLTNLDYVACHEAVRSELVIPLKNGDRVIGALDIQSSEPDDFTADDEQLLVLFANQAAIVLENTNLIAETETQVSRLKSLRTIDETITASFELEVTSAVLLTQIIEQLDVDAADLLLFDPHSKSLKFIGSRGFKTTALRYTDLRLGQGLAGKAASTRQLLQIHNLNEQEELMSAAPLLKEEGFVEYLGVPLIAKGTVKGLLEIFNRSTLATDESWENFLTTLAGQAAIAIDNIELFDNLQKSNNDLTLAYDENIEGWSRALDLRDKETEGHTQRVMEITIRLAKALGLSREELVHVRRGALLHDIGKMGIPDNILLKSGSLSEDEWQIMRLHPDYAFDLLSPIAFLKPALDIPYCHHEKWDGSGYPRGLKGEHIPLTARIFAVADVWDALRSDRPYRAAWPESKVVEYIREQAGSHFDPSIVEAFLNDYLADEGTQPKPTILIVDDEENVTRSLSRSLKDRFTVLTTTSAKAALEIVKRTEVAVILTDQRMPGMSGVELLEKIQQINQNSVGILISGYSDIVALTAAINLPNVHGFIPKPWDIEPLRTKLDAAVRQYQRLLRSQ